MRTEKHFVVVVWNYGEADMFPVASEHSAQSTLREFLTENPNTKKAKISTLICDGRFVDTPWEYAKC